ncbi:MurR/RpiR family transcriptional regulator [Spiroplasma culicicola]|uniref:RpiR family transcriptional regulator n=1 Tax=Spiroplasma culicicola AES-1 TaxID=1276246 RepID=W6A7Z6_9MOLU|nr:MurR/RpiR family transcriptional regulator [Spiroplasma culicicola]AHI53010.1 RpiR family transcriptional regulator [Spiroplasma culicicola AES-1]
MNKKSILDQIREIARYSENVSFQVIANFIIKNYMVLEKYTIFDVSKKTSTSPATVTRFCKYLGLNGYKTLNISLKFENQYMETFDVQNNDFGLSNEISLIEKLKEFTQLSLHNTTNINQNSLMKAKIIIEKSQNIFMFAKGGNIFLVHLFIDWLLRINLKTFFSQDTDQQMAYSNIIAKNDCALIISYSLSSNFFERIIKKLNDKGIQKIIITRNDVSNLISKDDVVIKIAENESIIENRQSSEVTTLFILKAIFHMLLNKDRINKLISSDNFYLK